MPPGVLCSPAMALSRQSRIWLQSGQVMSRFALKQSWQTMFSLYQPFWACCPHALSTKGYSWGSSFPMLESAHPCNAVEFCNMNMCVTAGFYSAKNLVKLSVNRNACCPNTFWNVNSKGFIWWMMWGCFRCSVKVTGYWVAHLKHWQNSTHIFLCKFLPFLKLTEEWKQTNKFSWCSVDFSDKVIFLLEISKMTHSLIFITVFTDHFHYKFN